MGRLGIGDRLNTNSKQKVYTDWKASRYSVKTGDKVSERIRSSCL